MEEEDYAGTIPDRALLAHLGKPENSQSLWLPVDRTEDLTEQLEQLRQQLLPRGVELRLLQLGPDRALVYVYRIRRLVRDLADPEIRQFLQGCGYRDFSAEGALAHLARRIAENGGEFPHEIGLFLGYPLGDVQGFITHRGQNCKCTGCWKVYCNEQEAQKQFCRLQSAGPFTVGCIRREPIFPG